MPYAIGSEVGRAQGDRASAGNAGGFRLVEGEVRQRGMEIALDFAINCSPDHPYVREHPEWFYQRPDGTIKFAENPPKKYEDIYPLNFRCENWRELWEEMKSIILFWASHGVRIFRVDNPHTKPVAILGISDLRRARQISRRDFSVRGVHAAENDEGAGQSGIHAELHLFHVAKYQSGA